MADPIAMTICFRGDPDDLLERFEPIPGPTLKVKEGRPAGAAPFRRRK